MPPEAEQRSSACPNAVWPSRIRPRSRPGCRGFEHGLQGRTPALERRNDECNLLERRPLAASSRSPPRRAPATRATLQPRRSGWHRRVQGLRAAYRRRWRSRCASASWPYSAAGRNSSICPPASAARSSCVRRSDVKAARPGSYGSETVTSVRPESASSSPHSAPVRSSNRRRRPVGRPTHRAPIEAARPRAEQVAIPEARADRAPLDRRRRAARDLLRVAQARAGRTRARAWPEANRQSPQPRGTAEAIQRRSSEDAPATNARCASLVTARASVAPSASSRKTSSNVPIDLRAGRGAPQQVRSIRSTSVLLGTIRTGSLSIAARYPPGDARSCRLSPARGRGQAHLPMVVRASDTPADEKVEERGSPRSPSGATGSPTSAGGRDARPAAAHLLGLGVGDVESRTPLRASWNVIESSRPYPRRSRCPRYRTQARSCEPLVFLLGEPDSARLPYRKAVHKSRGLARALDSP